MLFRPISAALIDFSDHRETTRPVLLDETGRKLLESPAFATYEVEGLLVTIGKKQWLKVVGFKKVEVPEEDMPEEGDEDDPEPPEPDDEEH